jgi:hypothetical protein
MSDNTVLDLHEELRLLAFRIQTDVRALVNISQQLAASGGPKAPGPKVMPSETKALDDRAPQPPAL